MTTIISLTTIPDRIEHIKPTVNSLLAQGLPVFVWPVAKIGRSETTLERVPDWLAESDAHVEIVDDRGPITKLLPALERIERADIIITADDDQIYGRGWATGLLAWAEKHPKAALGYRGRILTGKGYEKSKLVWKRVKRPRRVDIITGVCGALYRREFFDDDIFDEWRVFPQADDLLIAAHLKRRGVPCYVIPRNCSVRPAKWQHIVPLFKVNRGKNSVGNNRGLHLLGLET